MPHIRLEHTKDIHDADIKKIFISIQNVLINLAGVIDKKCKCRAIKLTNFQIGNSTKHGFIHLEINIIEGRSEKIKKKIGEESLNILKSYFDENLTGDFLQYSIEIRDINKESYLTSNKI